MVKTRFDLKYENKSVSSISVVERYRRGIEQNNWDINLGLVHYRGGEEEFQLGKTYLNSDDSLDRGVGADILGQLGWRDKTFLDLSVSLLISALQDKVDNVVYCDCIALGHRCDEKAIAHVIKFAQSPSTEIRNGVVFALLGQESAEAIDVMLLLSCDEDIDTRNWAMFGLGTQIASESPDIRQALLKGTSDKDSEIRGEALVGLANRNDSSIVQLIINEWETVEEVSILSIEAAEIVASSRLYSTLTELEKTLDLDEDVFFQFQLQHALDACRPKILRVV